MSQYTSITDAIEHIREKLEQSVSIRIIGLSGVGKTSLVQALFDHRVCPDSLCQASENVIYTDLARDPSPQPKAMLRNLKQKPSDIIVVIDNCAPRTHNELTKDIQGSRLRLITIEYDIRDDIPEDTICYRLEGASLEIIRKILKKKFKHLSDINADLISNFSDGNARVAFALACTVESGGEPSRLRQEELFERLFQQRNTHNDDLLRSAEAASLLYSFDCSDSSLDGETGILARIAEVTQATFSRNMMELERRGLVQKRGQWRAVLPHAIANRLAIRALESLSLDRLFATLIESGSERVKCSFTRRIGFLHDCKEAVDMASRMLAEGGMLGDLIAISDYECEMFTNLAPADPQGALSAIIRATRKECFPSIESQRRSRFARVTRSIAYSPVQFDKSVAILIHIALANSDDRVFESARNILKSLFWCYLSGTHATPVQRCKVVKDLIATGDDGEKQLAFDLLAAALETRDFVTHYDFGFGARSRDFGWYPKNQQDLQQWFRPWIGVVTALGEQDNEDGRKARKIFASAWRGLWSNVGLNDMLCDIAERFAAVDKWPDGWLAIRSILSLDRESLSPTERTQLRKLEKMLKPSDLISLIRARCTARSAFSYGVDEGDDDESTENSKERLSASDRRRKAEEHDKELGRRACQSPEIFEVLIGDLCSKNVQCGLYDFGFGVGKHHPNMVGLLDTIRRHIQLAEPRNLSVIWVRGLIAGWKERDHEELDSFLDDAVEDDVWLKWFVELQVQTSLSDRAFTRILHALDSGECPIWQFEYLAWGRATAPLTISQIMKLSEKVASRSDNGLYITLQILDSVIDSAKDKDEEYKKDLGRSLLNFLAYIDWELLNQHILPMDDNLGVVLNFALQSAESEGHVETIIDRMLSSVINKYGLYNNEIGTALVSFFQHFPRLTLELVCVPDDDGSFTRASQLVSNYSSMRSAMPLECVPKNILLDWCLLQPVLRFPFAASACQLYERSASDDSLKVSETAVELLNSAPEKSVVLDIFIKRFWPGTYSGSLAHILEQRITILDQLSDRCDDATRSEIAKAKANFMKSIAELRVNEEHEKRAQDNSFE